MTRVPRPLFPCWTCLVVGSAGGRPWWPMCRHRSGSRRGRGCAHHSGVATPWSVFQKKKSEPSAVRPIFCVLAKRVFIRAHKEGMAGGQPINSARAKLFHCHKAVQTTDSFTAKHPICHAPILGTHVTLGVFLVEDTRKYTIRPS